MEKQHMDTRPKNLLYFIKQTEQHLEKKNYQEALSTADKVLIASLNEKTAHNVLSQRLYTLGAQIFSKCGQPERSVLAKNLTLQALQLTSHKTKKYDLFFMHLNMACYTLALGETQEAILWIDKAFSILEPQQLFDETIIMSCLHRAHDFYRKSHDSIASSILMRLNDLTPANKKHLLYKKMFPEISEKVTEWIDITINPKPKPIQPENPPSTSWKQKAFSVYKKIHGALPVIMRSSDSKLSPQQDTKKVSPEHPNLESIRHALIIHHLKKIPQLKSTNKPLEALALGSEVLTLTSKLVTLDRQVARELLNTATQAFGDSIDPAHLTMATNLTLRYMILTDIENNLISKINLVYYYLMLNNYESALRWFNQTFDNVNIALPKSEHFQTSFIHYINLFHKIGWDEFANRMCRQILSLVSGEEKELICKRITPQVLNNLMTNDAIVLNVLAESYQQKDGRIDSLKKANQLFHESALLGNSKAMLNLAHNYQYGMGVNINLPRAIEWYAKALYSPTECQEATQQLELLKKTHPSLKNKINAQLAIVAFTKQDVQTAAQLMSQTNTSDLSSQECYDLGFFLFSHYQSHFSLVDYYFHSMQHRTAYSDQERQARLFDVICKYLQAAVQKNLLKTTLNPFYNPNSLDENAAVMRPLNNQNDALAEAVFISKEDMAFDKAEENAANEAKRLLSNMQNSFLLKGLDSHLETSQQKIYQNKAYALSNKVTLLFSQPKEGNNLRDKQQDTESTITKTILNYAKEY
jgi:hypothetical protein